MSDFNEYRNRREKLEAQFRLTEVTQRFKDQTSIVSLVDMNATDDNVKLVFTTKRDGTFDQLLREVQIEDVRIKAPWPQPH